MVGGVDCAAVQRSSGQYGWRGRDDDGGRQRIWCGGWSNQGRGESSRGKGVGTPCGLKERWRLACRGGL